MVVTSLLRLLVEGSGGGFTLVLGSVLVSLLLDEDGDEDRFALVTSLSGLLVACSGGGLSVSASVLVSSLLGEDVDEDWFVVFRRRRRFDWSGGWRMKLALLVLWCWWLEFGSESCSESLLEPEWWSSYSCSVLV